jgi:putative toxin-antitoxin system antitoxin component (TIGR02293 family)
MSTTSPPAEAHNELANVLAQVAFATHLLRQGEDIPGEVVSLIDELDTKLHADSPLRLEVDPYLSTMLFAGALRAVKSLRHDDLSTRRRDVRVALEQVRHALRDIVDRSPFAADVPVRDVLTRLASQLNVPQADLADLLGVSTRQLQRWLSANGAPLSGEDEARVRVVAEIVNHLRHVFTAPGALAWFRRPHPHLGEAPMELLKDPSTYPRLRDLAVGSRSMAG